MELGGDCECRQEKLALKLLAPLYPENQPDWLEKQTSISLVSEKGSSFGLLVGPGESWKRLEVFVEAQVEAGQLLNKSRAVFLLSSR